MNRREPKSPRAANSGKATGSRTESLRAPASHSHDRSFGTAWGRSGFILQTVASRARPLSPHAQPLRLSRSFFEPVPEGELASSSVGVRQNRLTLVVAERAVQSRKRGRTPLVFRPSASRVRRSENRSAPTSGRDRRFDPLLPVLTVASSPRSCGAEPLACFEQRFRSARGLVKTGGGLRRTPSRTKKRTVRPTPSFQRTPDAVSTVGGLRWFEAPRIGGGL